MGAAIRCPLVGDSTRGSETAEPLTSTPALWAQTQHSCHQGQINVPRAEGLNRFAVVIGSARVADQDERRPVVGVAIEPVVVTAGGEHGGDCGRQAAFGGFAPIDATG